MSRKNSSPWKKVFYQPAGSRVYKYPSFEDFSRQTEFRHQHDMRKFVNAALREPHKDTVVSALSHPPMLTLMERLLDADYTLNAGNFRNRISFQNIAVPFVHLLVHPEFKNSILPVSLTKIFNTVFSNANFLRNYGNNLESLVRQRAVLLDPNGTLEDASEFSIRSLSDVICPFVEMVQEGLKCVPGATNDLLLTDLLPILREGCSMCKTHRTTSDDNRRLALSISFLEDMIFKYVDHESTPSKQPNRSHQDKDDFPGDLSPQGPRHDNDHQNYRDISIFPTASETICTREPFLPRLTDDGAVEYHWLGKSTERYIDNHFRLLREDLTRTFRRGICQFFEQNFLKCQGKESHRFEVMGDHGADGLVIVWQGVRVIDILSHPLPGTSFALSVSQIFSDEQEEDRHASWTTTQGSKILQVGSLVCLIFSGEEDSKELSTSDHASSCEEMSPSVSRDHSSSSEETGPSVSGVKSAVDGSFIDTNGAVIVFAKVVEDNRMNLSNNPARCTVYVRPVADEDVPYLISRMGQVSDLTERCSGSAVMLQLLGHFITGTETVLQCLKSLDLTGIPWFDHITKPSSDLSEKSSCGDRKGTIGAPPYIGSSTTYDLSFLAETEEASKDLKSVPIGDAEVAMEKLQKHIGGIRLDNSQLEAFMNGISKGICLIQGPPGCGKTYIGVHIVKAILLNENRAPTHSNVHGEPEFKRNYCLGSDSSPPPILCVCFTNHALDQFLESLVNSGAVNIEDVVRIGSRSNSEMLKDQGLNKFSIRTKEEKREHYNARNEYAASVSAVDTLVSIIHGDTGGSKFAQWLKLNRISLFNDIISSEEDGSSNSEVNEELFDDILVRWIELAEFESIQQARKQKLEMARLSFLQEVRDELKKCYYNAQRSFLKLQDSKNMSKLRTLRGARVVGCTTSGAAFRRRLLGALGARIIIGEEAAEACEGHMLSTLSSRTEHLILIGDHLQLRPRVAEYDLTVDSNLGYNLDVSLFERLAGGNMVPISKLSTQRRMHPEIADLARLLLYPFLKDADTVINQGSPDGFQYPVYFWSHDHEEEDTNETVGRNRSHFNDHEVDLITGLTRYTIKQGYSPSNIAILTPYLAQLKRIRERFSEEEVSAILTDRNMEELAFANITLDVTNTPNFTNSATMYDEDGELKQTTMEDCVRLSTVDNFQGEEADIVLISTVRGNEVGNLGFLKSSNRTNVMLTRARKGMFIIGNSSTLLSAPQNTLLYKVMDHLQQRKRVSPVIPLKCQNHGNINFISHSKGFPADGGCTEVCKKPLPCGHSCSRECHPDDSEHVHHKCQEQCEKTLEPCGHACVRKCHEECEDCSISIQVSLPCGHSMETTCGRSRDGNQKCRTIISFTEKESCKHIVPLHCWEGDVSQTACEEICGQTRQCGHMCLEMCHTEGERGGETLHRQMGTCSQVCGLQLNCGHTCNQYCHQGSVCKGCTKLCAGGCRHALCKELCMEACTGCSEMCDWECTCGGGKGACKELCRRPCVRGPCDAGCMKMLGCGHRCPSVCGEECPPPEFCKECGLGPVVSGQMADLIGLRTLGELREADGPIIVLDCQHAFTLGTLDGYFGMGLFFESEESGGWGCARPVSEVVGAGTLGDWKGLAECPVCQTVIKGVRRYHRVTRIRLLGKETAAWACELQGRVGDIGERMKDVFRIMGKDLLVSSGKMREGDVHVMEDVQNRVQTNLGQLARVKQQMSKEHPFTVCKEDVSDVIEASTRKLRARLAYTQMESGMLQCRFSVFMSVQRRNVETWSEEGCVGRLRACFRNLVQMWEKGVEEVRQTDGESGVKKLTGRYRSGLMVFMADVGEVSGVSGRVGLAARKLRAECNVELIRVASKRDGGRQ